MLASLAGDLGLLFAVCGVKVISFISPYQFPRTNMIGIDGWVYGYTLSITILTGLVFGIFPAIRTANVNLNKLVKENTRSYGGGRQHSRLRNFLITMEITLTFVLLICTGLFLKSFLILLRDDSGFKPEGVLTAGISLPYVRYPKSNQVVEFYKQLETNIQEIPGVLSTGATSDLPWSGYDENASFIIEGESHTHNESTHARFHWVTPGYFPTIGVPLLKGRHLTNRDNIDAQSVILINESMANKYWDKLDVVGKRINSYPNSDEAWMTIVGIVGDIKDAPDEVEAEPAFYRAHSQMSRRKMILAIRTDTNPMTLIDSVRREVRAMDSALPLYNIQTMEQIATDAYARSRFVLILLSFYSMAGLVLAAVGIYGVLANSVSQQTKEIAIRIALGAHRWKLIRIILYHGLILTTVGLIIGYVGALSLSRLMSSLLYGVEPNDPFTFFLVTVIIGCVALIACLVPAIKATRINPMEALRYE